MDGKSDRPILEVCAPLEPPAPAPRRSCMHPLASHRIPPATRFRAHAHDGPHVCVPLAGGFSEFDGHGWRDVPAGTVRVSASARHDIDFGQAGARCLLLLPGPGVGLTRLERLARPCFLAPDPWLGELTRRIDQVITAGDPAGDTVLDSLATEFLAQLDRRLAGRASSPPAWLSRVRELLEDSHGAVSVAALAREAGVHRVHLARAFREHLGMPVTERARALRLASAQRLLLTTDLPLAEVAARTGWADQSHLTRAIRRAFGTTPAALRRARLHPFKTGTAARH